MGRVEGSVLFLNPSHWKLLISPENVLNNVNVKNTLVTNFFDQAINRNMRILNIILSVFLTSEDNLPNHL